MTLNELLKEVSALGFYENSELDESFVFSVNRALKMIFTELAPTSVLKIKIDEKNEKSFDIRSKASDVMFITSAPMDYSGCIIKGAHTDGYLITLPDDFSGDAFIHYKPAAKKVSIDNVEEEIDVPEYASHLLPLLTSFFVFLDDDSEKAEYYMSLYRSEVLKILRTYSLSRNNTYSDVTGWA